MATTECIYSGGGSEPTEYVEYTGIAYISNSGFARDYGTNPSISGFMVDGSDITKQLTLCDYTFTTNFKLRITAKTKVKIKTRIYVENPSTDTINEQILTNGQSVLLEMSPLGASGYAQGYFVETWKA